MTSERLRTALTRLKLTQLQLAKLFQLSLRTVQHYAAGGVTNTPTAILIVLLLQKKITIPDIEKARRMT
jgi:transcriptional regulator with XRE-family HTH domain